MQQHSLFKKMMLTLPFFVWLEKLFTKKKDFKPLVFKEVFDRKYLIKIIWGLGWIIGYPSGSKGGSQFSLTDGLLVHFSLMPAV